MQSSFSHGTTTKHNIRIIEEDDEEEEENNPIQLCILLSSGQNLEKEQGNRTR